MCHIYIYYIYAQKLCWLILSKKRSPTTTRVSSSVFVGVVVLLWSLHSARSVVYPVRCVFDSPGVWNRHGIWGWSSHRTALQLIIYRERYPIHIYIYMYTWWPHTYTITHMFNTHVVDTGYLYSMCCLNFRFPMLIWHRHVGDVWFFIGSKLSLGS